MKKLLLPHYNKTIPSLTRKLVELYEQTGDVYKLERATEELLTFDHRVPDEKKLAKLQVAILQLVLLHSSIRKRYESVQGEIEEGTRSRHSGRNSKKATIS